MKKKEKRKIKQYKVNDKEQNRMKTEMKNKEKNEII